MKKIRFIGGIAVTVLFLVHVVLMTLLLEGRIPYDPKLKYTGIALVVVMVIHILLCVVNGSNKQNRKQRFYLLKWITGIMISLILIVHGRDYVEEINLLGLRFHKGVMAACIELVFLIVSMLHIRINVGSMCDHLGMEGKRKLTWGRIFCGIATVVIVIPGIAIWKYFV